MDEYAYLLKFVPNENPARFIYFHSESVVLIYSHKYVNLLQITIKDIENEKVRCVFQNSWNDFGVSWFEVITLDDGMFPR